MKVIISTGNRKLIGEVVEEDLQPGDNTIIKNAYELRCDMFLVPTQQGMGALNKTSIVPIDAEEEPVDILVKIDNIRWFKDMSDKGLKYENMIEEFEEMLVQSRAQRAGITPARNIPNSGGSGIII